MFSGGWQGRSRHFPPFHLRYVSNWFTFYLSSYFPSRGCILFSTVGRRVPVVATDKVGFGFGLDFIRALPYVGTYSCTPLPSSSFVRFYFHRITEQGQSGMHLVRVDTALRYASGYAFASLFQGWLSVLFGLEGIEAGVGSVLGEEFVVCAVFLDASVFDDGDFVCHADGAKAVGN